MTGAPEKLPSHRLDHETGRRSGPRGPDSPSKSSPNGERRKPQPNGKPGYVRVDSVHLGDLEGKKGSYIINVVDEVTQHEHLMCVERLTHRFLGPALEKLIDAFPFVVHAFHADNGSSEFETDAGSPRVV